MRLKLPRPWWRRSRLDDRLDSDHETSAVQSTSDLGALMRSRREAMGLSLRDLANETRITTPVIEALERGWKDRLPERAYLASMLPQLERRLDLAPGCLDPVLPPRATARQNSAGRLRRFTPGSIDVFTTWQGTVVYVLVIAVSLLALNRQQQDLAQRNSLALEPVRADLAQLTRRGASGGSSSSASVSGQSVVQGLRPLEQAAERRPIEWLEGDVPAQIGLLQITLSEPRQLVVSSRGGDRINLKGGAGQLTLQLLPPVQLSIQPPLAPTDQVLWNGDAQKPEAVGKGAYRIEADSPEPAVPRKPADPARVRPQTAPRSP